MKISSGGRDFDVCFITCTWRGDLDRFAMLREMIRRAFNDPAVKLPVMQADDQLGAHRAPPASP